MVHDRNLRDVLDWGSRALGRGALSLVDVLKSEGGSLVYKLAPAALEDPSDFIIVRRYTDQAWLDREPYLPANEERMTRFAHETGLPAPRLLGARHEGAPLVATGFVHGSPVRPEEVDLDFIEAAAEAARFVHQHSIPAGAPQMRVFEPHYLFTNVEVREPAWACNGVIWSRAIEIYHAFSTPTARNLLHRDFHFGNLLFSRRRLTGIVDWVTACLGDPGSDIAHMRWNLLLSHGEDAMRAFTLAYYDSAEFHDPVWDIYAVVGALPELRSVTHAQANRLETLMGHAVSALGAY